MHWRSDQTPLWASADQVSLILEPTTMGKHVKKSKLQIEEEIRRQAQGAADAKGESVTITMPSIAIATEPTRSGSHWILAETSNLGRTYVEMAALRLAYLWDVEPR